MARQWTKVEKGKNMIEEQWETTAVLTGKSIEFTGEVYREVKEILHAYCNSRSTREIHIALLERTYSSILQNSPSQLLSIGRTALDDQATKVLANVNEKFAVLRETPNRIVDIGK